MKRQIYNALRAWKRSPRRKPLILKGARQVGKTYILKRFAEDEYDNVAYLNFENTPELGTIFSAQLDVNRLIKEIAIVSNTEVSAGKTLIIFDEIQASNHALNALKFFNENANQYHIAAAGSLLGLTLSKPKSFPVGKVNLLDMYPMDFLEFLDAIGKSNLKQLIGEWREFQPVSEIFHKELLSLLKQYFLVGGMPEVIQHFIDSGKFTDVREIQREILTTYELDFSKHAHTTDIPKIGRIWHSLPSQLAKENKKFLYNVVKKGARAREYESALQWLEAAGMIYRSTCVTTPRIPLKSYCDISAFKIYMLDTGLLGAMSGLPMETLLDESSLFMESKGALTENYVAQQLKATHDTDLFYWSSKGRAEIDFLFQGEKDIYPLEVKSGTTIRSKSLYVYDEKFHPPALSRTSLLNIKRDDRYYNYPLYAVSLFPGLMQ